MPVLPFGLLEPTSLQFYKTEGKRSLLQLSPPQDILLADLSDLSLSQAELTLATMADGLPDCQGLEENTEGGPGSSVLRWLQGWLQQVNL